MPYNRRSRECFTLLPYFLPYSYLSLCIWPVNSNCSRSFAVGSHWLIIFVVCLRNDLHPSKSPKKHLHNAAENTSCHTRALPDARPSQRRMRPINVCAHERLARSRTLRLRRIVQVPELRHRLLPEPIRRGLRSRRSRLRVQPMRQRWRMARTSQALRSFVSVRPEM